MKISILLCFGLMALFLAAKASIDKTCGTNCPFSDCATCPCGNQTNYISEKDYTDICYNDDGDVNYPWGNQGDCCVFLIKQTSKGNLNHVT